MATTQPPEPQSYKAELLAQAKKAAGDALRESVDTAPTPADLAAIKKLAEADGGPIRPIQGRSPEVRLEQLRRRQSRIAKSNAKCAPMSAETARLTGDAAGQRRWEELARKADASESDRERASQAVHNEQKRCLDLLTEHARRQQWSAIARARSRRTGTRRLPRNGRVSTGRREARPGGTRKRTSSSSGASRDGPGDLDDEPPSPEPGARPRSDDSDALDPAVLAAAIAPRLDAFSFSFPWLWAELEDAATGASRLLFEVLAFLDPAYERLGWRLIGESR